MAAKYFYVHNGLTVGQLTVDADTGNLTTIGTGNFTNTTQSTSTTTGALVVSGGIGIAKDVRIGGNVHANTLYSNGNVAVTTASFVPGNGIQINVNTTSSTVEISALTGVGGLNLDFGYITDTATIEGSFDFGSI